MERGRMRRVDEAVRAVLSDAIAKDLKDPRVGFVTVTGVKTSPDLRHARVYVSVLGDEPTRAPRASTGLRSAHGFLQAGSPRELTLKHTPDADVRVRRVGRPRDADHRAARTRTRRRAAMTENGDRSSREHVLDELRSCREADRRHAREPRRRRARLADRDAGDPDRARQGQRDVHRRERVPAAARVPLLPARRARVRRRPTTSTSARSCSSTAATSSATRPRRFSGPAAPHPQHRPPPRQHALRDRQPRRPGRLLHRRDRLGPDARRSASTPTPTIAEALYVGLITDTGRFMYENTGAAGAPDGGRADRGRRRCPRDLPARLRGRPVRQARAARARARERPALRRGPADRDAR